MFSVGEKIRNFCPLPLRFNLEVLICWWQSYWFSYTPEFKPQAAWPNQLHHRLQIQNLRFESQGEFIIFSRFSLWEAPYAGTTSLYGGKIRIKIWPGCRDRWKRALYEWKPSKEAHYYYKVLQYYQFSCLALSMFLILDHNIARTNI